MQVSDVASLVAALPGVRSASEPHGLIGWRYHGRLVARQLDDSHIVIRTPLEVREGMLRQFPATFTVPDRFAKHMMIVADLAAGDPGAIEDALIAAWQLQRGAE